MRLRTFLLLVALLLPCNASSSSAVAPWLVLEVVQGDGAIHNVAGRSFVDPVVLLLDQGNPVAGAIVTFLLPQVGAGGSFQDGPIATVTTGTDGTATARGLRPNALTGQWEIRVAASASGRTARASILQINAAPAGPVAAKSRSRTYMLLGIVAGGALAGAVAAFSGGGSAAAAPASAIPLPPAAVTNPPAVISAGSGTFGPPTP